MNKATPDSNTRKAGPGRPKSDQPPKLPRVLLRAENIAKHAEWVRQFDTFPDSQFVPNGAVAAWLSIAMPTYWKRVKLGRLPKPQLIDGISRQNVGEVRRAVAALRAPVVKTTVKPPWL